MRLFTTLKEEADQMDLKLFEFLKWFEFGFKENFEDL
jgi:hypothetical protein